ncbi:MAG: hypothetical protein KatS3mg129_1201 [Leptospiraceae bacterium]|nr:MAG: hypothetical protein KatS3mg129_1201 [Leptospiraceae bacterium]
MKKYLFFNIVFILIFLYCKYNNHISIKNLENTVQSKITLSKEWNDLKKFFYGSEVSQDSYLYKYQQANWYIKEIKKLKSMELKLQERRRIIQQWHKENLTETYYIKNAVYLLSGADLYHFMLFYPEADNYIMIAMEKTGNILNNYSEDDLKFGILNILNILNNLTHSGYLFSRTMKEYMIKNELKNLSGTLPEILYFINFFHYDIIDIYKICLKYKKDTCTIPGLHYKIINENHQIKNIYYISHKLEPDDFINNSILDSFLNKFSNKGLFLKAAVYLFHFQEFLDSNIYLINNFNSIIQDDSGIPYRYLKQGNYNIKLFGEYKDKTNLKKTINPFQKDLYIDFKNNKEKLPFMFGYAQARKSNLSNLIYAYRL